MRERLLMQMRILETLLYMSSGCPDLVITIKKVITRRLELSIKGNLADCFELGAHTP